MTEKLAIFKGKEIRRIIHNDEWWFSVVDVCGALTDSADAGAYWRKIKDGSEVVTKCHGLKLVATDGKKYTTDCANTEGIFRIIQSIPSPKAEPFKRWLAKVGYERVQEIEDPESDFIMLSALQHYLFCPRQCALIHIEHLSESIKGGREHCLTKIEPTSLQLK